MKLSQTIAKLTGGKVKVFGVLGGLMLAGAAMTAAAPKADAQVAFGVRIGVPRYYAPAPAYGYAEPAYPAYGYAAPAYGYVAPRYEWEQRHELEQRRGEDWREHEYMEHHDADRRFDRDHDRRDWR